MMSVCLCCWRNENVLSFYTCLIAGRLCGSGLCVAEKSILEFPGRRDTYKSQLGGDARDDWHFAVVTRLLLFAAASRYDTAYFRIRRGWQAARDPPLLQSGSL